MSKPKGSRPQRGWIHTEALQENCVDTIAIQDKAITLDKLSPQLREQIEQIYARIDQLKTLVSATVSSSSSDVVIDSAMIQISKGKRGRPRKGGQA